jgi:hypothetical protein
MMAVKLPDMAAKVPFMAQNQRTSKLLKLSLRSYFHMLDSMSKSTLAGLLLIRL